MRSKKKIKEEIEHGTDHVQLQLIAELLLDIRELLKTRKKSLLQFRGDSE